MLVFGASIINWSAILKIVIAALIGGCGIVIVYGFLLLGLKYATTAGSSGTPGEGSKVVGYALAAICAILVVGVVVLGISAMPQKPPGSVGGPAQQPTRDRRDVPLASSSRTKSPGTRSSQ